MQWCTTTRGATRERRERRRNRDGKRRDLCFRSCSLWRIHTMSVLFNVSHLIRCVKMCFLSRKTLLAKHFRIRYWNVTIRRNVNPPLFCRSLRTDDSGNYTRSITAIYVTDVSEDSFNSLFFFFSYAYCTSASSRTRCVYQARSIHIVSTLSTTSSR